MAEPCGRLSAWRDTAALDEATARDMLERLELRAQAADEVAARAQYLGLLDVKPGARVLDVGCGSGVVTRDVARRVAPGGRAVGVDASPAFVALARERAAAAGLAELVEFHVGDCRALPFPDESFDAAVAATVLAHVPGGERAIPEMARVVRPGGRVGVFDFDGDGVLIAHPDRALTRRIVAAASDHAAVNPWLARELPAHLVAAGLEDVQARAFMPLEREAGSFHARLAERHAEVAREAGAISAEEQARWLDGLRAQLAAGRFLGGRLHVFAWGVKPARR